MQWLRRQLFQWLGRISAAVLLVVATGCGGEAVETKATEPPNKPTEQPAEIAAVSFTSISGAEVKAPLERAKAGAESRQVLWKPLTESPKNVELGEGEAIALSDVLDATRLRPESTGVIVHAKPPLSQGTLPLDDEAVQWSKLEAWHRVVALPSGWTPDGAAGTRISLGPELAGEDKTARVWAHEIVALPFEWTSEPVDVPPEGKLAVAFTMLDAGPVPAEALIEFSVLARESSETTTLIDMTLDAISIGQHDWRDAVADVSRLAGRRVQLVYRVRDLKPEVFAREPWGRVPVFGESVLMGAADGAARKPNVILISLDTLAAKHMSCYGYERGTTPNIDALARRWTLFENAFAASTWTMPSHGTIFTGDHPSVHGAGIRSLGGPLQDSCTTMAEVAKADGRLTAAFAEGGYLRGDLGFNQGFDRFSDGTEAGEVPSRMVEETFGKARRWLDTFGGAPFFLFVHTYEVHWPYDPPDPYRLKFTQETFRPAPRPDQADQVTEADKKRFLDHYDGEVAYTDAAVGAFVEYLEGRGLLDNTIVIILSDHGEAFWEHGSWGHTTHTYDEVIHVPLIVHGPGLPPGRVRGLVSTADVFSTVCDFWGVAPPEGLYSRSLRPLLENPEVEHFRDDVSSEVILALMAPKYREKFGASVVEWMERSLRSSREKYMITNREAVLHAADVEPAGVHEAQGQFQERLYEVASDPEEQHDLAPTAPDRLAELRKRHEAFLQEQGVKWMPQQQSGPVENKLDSDESHEQLRALGYF